MFPDDILAAEAATPVAPSLEVTKTLADRLRTDAAMWRRITAHLPCAGSVAGSFVDCITIVVGHKGMTLARQLALVTASDISAAESLAEQYQVATKRSNAKVMARAAAAVRAGRVFVCRVVIKPLWHVQANIRMGHVWFSASHALGCVVHAGGCTVIGEDASVIAGAVIAGFRPTTINIVTGGEPGLCVLWAAMFTLGVLAAGLDADPESTKSQLQQHTHWYFRLFVRLAITVGCTS